MNAISDETRYRSEQLQAHGKLERLSIACGLTEPSMQQFGGLFVGEGRSDDKPLDDLLHAIDYLDEDRVSRSRPDRLRYASEIDSQGPPVAPRHPVPFA